MSIDLLANITKEGHFKWSEYLWQQGFKQYGQPTPEQQANIILLFTRIEEYIREPFGQSLTISSGFRSDAYTANLRARGIPAALHSAHNTGEAVDLHIPRNKTPRQFWDWCSARWPGRMELSSFTPTWCHLDIRQWSQKVRFAP